MCSASEQSDGTPESVTLYRNCHTHETWREWRGGDRPSADIREYAQFMRTDEAESLLAVERERVRDYDTVLRELLAACQPIGWSFRRMSAAKNAAELLLSSASTGGAPDAE